MSSGRPDGLPLVWGATPDEARRAYPADELVSGTPLRMTRAVAVHAPPTVTWRWLCQVAVAPYSYDWIDNLGRRSPRELTPGADTLELGQAMAIVFRLTSYDAPHQWTGVTGRGSRVVGPVGLTYAAEPVAGRPERSRIVARMTVGASGPLTRARGQALAWGDLVMMRKQLLTLKGLAERDAARD